MVRLVAFSGSLRKDSWNKKLVRIAADGARAAGAEVTLLDLADFPMPLFDEDLERTQGAPTSAQQWKAALKACDGMIIASPEYNSSVSAALKNAIDWASRPSPGEPPLAAFAGKIAVLMAASPGALGGLRGLVHLRAILGNIQMLVLPDQRAIPKAHEAFAPDGALKDAKLADEVRDLGRRLAEVTQQLARK
ncbi:MAG: NAD(P)H-dependent oxidoreductase [Planctomycetes bacterium]|nr:NAD(P)H-dependent oxidoreductase [Planctomycetota bacterium]MCC7170790.1 NAD(P)H-dependent oxidoreductase [Planctomycetota bacterium]